MHNIIIVEDEPLLLEYYESVLNNAIPPCNIIGFTKIDGVLETLESFAQEKKRLLLVIVDLYIKDLETRERNNGIQVLSKLQKHRFFNKTKKAVVTSSTTDYDIASVFEVLVPDIFLVKNDIANQQYLLSVFKGVLTNKRFYSETIDRYVFNKAISDTFFDQIDRKILLLIQNSYSNKKIAEELAISKSAIEKRKFNMSIRLGIDVHSNQELLSKAKSLMII